jgi:DNA-3-methyladenine glycosylase
VISRLPPTFFARPSLVVAPELLGHELVRRLPGDGELRVRLVETEAYRQDDPASHSFRGRTPRNAVMFGQPGRLYVYFTYGMHHCINIVTGADGEGSAVLLRAAEPLDGLDAMARRRGTDRTRALCSGPARLAEALGVDRSLDGVDLLRGDLIWLERGAQVPPDRVVTGPRVGIRRAVEEPWRFCEAGSPWVSRGRPGPPPVRARPRVASQR